MPVGLSFRENIEGDTFVDFSPFLPHHVKGTGGATFEFKSTELMQDYNRELYKSFNPSSLYDKYSMKVKYLVFDDNLDLIDHYKKEKKLHYTDLDAKLLAKKGGATD